jgi:hypothetical protein
MAATIPATAHGTSLELETHHANGHTAHHESIGKHFIEEIKDVNDAEDLEDNGDDPNDPTLRATKSTRQDARSMRSMGKDQQLVRNFRLLSITSFVAIATASWEIGLFVITPALIDAGRSGLVYNQIWNFIGFGPIYLSMAEMASMAPIAGAQYRMMQPQFLSLCSRTVPEPVSLTRAPKT